MTTRCTRTTLERHRKLRTLGFIDEKGRAVGFRITYQKVRYAKTDSLNGAYVHEPGVFYVADTSVTRDGQDFGALTTSLEAKTMEALEVLVQKRIAGTIKRYRQKYGG